MSCSGLHCASCSGGAAMPVVPLAAVYGLAWVAEHIIEVAIVSSACGALAVAAVAALMRWADRRDARHAALGPLMVTRGEPALPTLAVTVMPQVSRQEPPAIEQHVHYYHHAAASQAAAAITKRELTMAKKDGSSLLASLVRTKPPRDPAEIDDAVIEADKGGESGKK